MKEIDVLILNVISEFEEFRTTEISKPAAHVFEDSGKIYFYENICDYFKYSEFDYDDNISEILTDLFLRKEELNLKSNIIESLWNCYLSNDYLPVSTYEDIEDLIESATC